MGTRLEFAILGPVEVRLDGMPVRIGGPRQRALLAMLLCHANRVVSRDRLVDELLGDQPAASADRALRVQVSRLRKALTVAGQEPRVLARPPGYCLRVECGELDLHEFERLVAQGRHALTQNDLARASAALREAEGLWRGRPLADLEYEPFARLEVARLEELRVSAVEDRIEADLALGGSATVCPALEALVAEHPLRERPRAQLMRALYSNGRQADALTVYANTRRLLVEELGLEPGEELQELERQVLNHDPSLRPPTKLQAPRASPSHAPQAKKRLAAIATIMIIGALTVLAITQAVTDPRGPVGLHAPAVAFLDASSGKLVAQVPGDELGIIRSGAGSIWTLQQSGVVLQIDPHTLRLTRSIGLGDIGAGSDIAVGDGAAWVTMRSKTVARIDSRFGTVSRVPLPQRGLTRPGAAGGIAIGAGSLWVAQGSSRVLRLDPASRRVQHRFSVPDANVVAYGAGAIWVASSEVGRLTKIDPRTNTIAASSRIGPWICCLAIGGGYAWAANNDGIHKLSLDDKPLTTVDTPSSTGGMSYGDGGLWVANDVAGTVTRIDPRSDRTTSHHIGHLLIGLGVAGQLIAVSAAPTVTDVLAGLTGRVLRIVYTSVWPDITDPAVAAAPGRGNWPQEQQFQSATCAPLLTIAASGRLVPEVATAPPTVSVDGRTYTFRIGHNYRFSPPSNAPVTAATMKYSIERALSPPLGPAPPAAGLVPDIVGVRPYRAGKAGHVAGISATADTLSIRLIHPAPDFPERIAASNFCPVPIGTPLGSPSSIGNGLDHPIPSAGPYYLTGNIGGAAAVLKRNPNYHGTRPRRLDAIVYRQNNRLDHAVARVVSGTADYAAERGPALAPESPVARGFAHGRPSQRRYLLEPLLGTDELAFNPHGHLVDKPRVRRAISVALDRPALAAALGDLVTDHYLPPGMPGFTDRHVYPLGLPDLRRARALVGARTGRVSLALCSEPECATVGRLVRANLQPIGLRVQLLRYGGDIAPLTRRRRADIVLARIFAPYADPVAFLRAALGPAAPRQRLRTLMRLALRRRPAAAARLEHAELLRAAPAAAFGTPTMPELFSTRVGCKTFPRITFGVDLGSLCLRPS